MLPLLLGLTTSHYSGLQLYLIHLEREAGGYPCSKTSISKSSTWQELGICLNANALNHNPIGSHDEDEDFGGGDIR
jgi:hypothetical protein